MNDPNTAVRLRCAAPQPICLLLCPHAENTRQSQSNLRFASARLQITVLAPTDRAFLAFLKWLGGRLLRQRTWRHWLPAGCHAWERAPRAAHAAGPASAAAVPAACQVSPPTTMTSFSKTPPTWRCLERWAAAALPAHAPLSLPQLALHAASVPASMQAQLAAVS